MTLAETTLKVQSLSTQKGGRLGAKIKFQFDEGWILLDDTVSPAIVNNENATADCTVKVSLVNFNKLLSGDMNAMGAFMMGKLKIEGDMNIAMKLSSLF